MKKPLLWIAANALILFGGPVLFYLYPERLLDHEYATGVRTSTGGDITLIPVTGLFVLLLTSLLIINAALGCYVWLRRPGRLP